ncbi:MAG: amidohydrolase family protein [Ignavibacteria bacterium]|nr:amidohydrolase family protein [Ignavibacteria bacterium]
MENKFSVIKNGLCLTLDNFSRSGYYNVIIKGNKIFDIDYNNELNSDKEIYKKFPDVYIYDAVNKIIIPSFFNSFKNSTFHLSGPFLSQSTYEDLETNISLRLIEKHLSSSKVNPDLINLFSLSFIKSLLNGETFINESSKLITAELLTSNAVNSISVKPDLVFTVYDNYISDYCLGVKRFHCIGLKDENDLNNYSLASVRKAIQKGNKRAVIESMQSGNNTDILRNLFGKSFIKALGDNDLLTPNLILANPVYLNSEELNIISENKVNVLLSPSDWLTLSVREPEFERFINRKLNLLIGTGITGKSVFTELKIFNNIVRRLNISSEFLMKMIISNPAEIFGIANICGSIEKNKLASFIMFDLNDIRNFLVIPEINSEKICDFIIEYLDEKDISDIFYRGLHFLNNYKCEYINRRELYEINSNLSGIIFEKGKYNEFKEKRMMHDRVDKLSLGIEGDELRRQADADNKSVPDVLQNELLTDESEFRIIGTKRINIPITEDLGDNASAESSWLDDLSRHVKELTNFRNGFDFINDFYEEYSGIGSRSKEEYNLTLDKKPTKKMFFDDASGESIFEDLDKSRDNPVITKPVPEPLKEPRKTIFKKNKLKFGFDDENNPTEE